jgi:hypothetical protein
MKNIFLIILLLIAAISFCNGQSCEIFKAPKVNVYLYPVEGEVSVSKLNDTVIYSLEKIRATSYKVQKIISGKLKEEHIYKYKGKYKYEIFRVKKRKIDKIYFIKEKRRICLLE